jgi:hypothetical protein
MVVDLQENGLVGSGPFDVFSLLSEDVWLQQKISNVEFSKIFAKISKFKLNVSERQLEIIKEIASDTTPDNISDRQAAKTELASIQPMVHASLVPNITDPRSRFGQPVLRTPIQQIGGASRSGPIQVTEFLRQHGDQYFSHNPAEETTFLSEKYGPSELASYLTRISGQRESLVQDYIARLTSWRADWNATGKDCDDPSAFRYSDGKHETISFPVFTKHLDEQEVEKKISDCISSNRQIVSRFWVMPWGRVISLTLNDGAEGSSMVLGSDVCIFSIPFEQSIRKESGNCYSGLAVVGTEMPPRFIAELPSDEMVALGFREDDTLKFFDVVTTERKFELKDMKDLAGTESLRLSKNTSHLLQVNSDGRFFIYDVKNEKRILSGISVDGEVVIFDDNGYYDSTPEGAHYIYWLFPGISEHFTFNQFASRLHREDVIQAILNGEHAKAPTVELTVPPTVELEVLTPEVAAAGPARVSVAARSSEVLRSIRLFVDGVPVEEIPSSGSFASAQRDISIAQGAHWVTAVAYDSSGYSSVPKSVRVSGVGSSIAKGRLFYVGIAVDQYPGIPNGNLRFAKRDMQLLADTLKARAGVQYRDIRTVLLGDTQVTPESIVGALNSAVSEAKPEDTVIVSFAGHGIGNKGFFFLTSGATRADLTSSALNWDKAASVLATSRAKVIVLLDACHSGLASQDTVVPNDAYAAALMRSGKAGMAILAASKGREFSQERENLDGGHGLFSYAVARALDKDRDIADWRHDGIIDLDALYRYVKNYVSNATGSGVQKQTPWLSRDELVGQVPVL